MDLIFGLSSNQIIILIIILILFLYVIICIVSLCKNKDNVNFTSAIVNVDGRISKSGVLFLFLTLVVIYQALFGLPITDGLLEILAVLAFKDAGIEIANKWERVQLHRVKKTRETLDLNEFKDL